MVGVEKLKETGHIFSLPLLETSSCNVASASDS